MVDDDQCEFLGARKSLVLRTASGVVGLERWVEAGRGLSVVSEALHEAGAIEVAWLLRVQGDTILRLIQVGENWMARELRVEPQDLHAVWVELCDHFGLWAEQADVMSCDGVPGGLPVCQFVETASEAVGRKQTYRTLNLVRVLL
jgi:hypothetical protein